MITIIAAVAGGGAIGRRGDLLFHISADLRRFKTLTTGHPVVMGRKTFESFPSGPLPGRRNIVVTRNRAYDRPGAETAQSLADAIAMTGGDAFVIGGGEIYAQALPLADRLCLTLVDAVVPDADTFFPETDFSQWTETDRSEDLVDPKTGVTYRFVNFERKR